MKNPSELLFGWDKESDIVAVEKVKDKDLVQIFKRKDGVLSSYFQKLSYFFYTTKEDKTNEKFKLRSQELFGENHYDVMLFSDTQKEMYTYRKQNKDVFIPFIDSQYLIQTGKTLFKGMEFNDPLVLYLDIEVLTSKGYHFPNSSRKDDKIIIVSLKTNKGYEKLLVLNEDENTNKGDNRKLYSTERDLLVGLVSGIRGVDPDIIANHNIFNFDFKYIDDRCNYNGVAFSIGRDGAEPRSFTTSIKFGDREREYINYDVYGRHIIDTQFLAEYADVVLRNMPSYQLKDLVKYLGKAKEDRTYIEGGQITNYWFENREELLKYALEDVYEAEVLYNAFGVSVFLQTTFVPMSFQEVFRYGTGNQIDYIFLRNYYRHNWSFSKPEPQRKIKGGYADVLRYGLIREPVIYADVESLYPSLARTLSIQPKRDELKIFQSLVTLMIDLRFQYKNEMKDFSKKIKDNNKEIEELKKKLDFL